MARFKDRAGRDMVLAMTHEEIVADLLRDVVRSYRQLPVMLYQFQTKFRDEPRSRGGLIRVREFTMKDAYSCDRDEAGLDVSYQAQYGAYSRIFERLGLETIVVGADVGMMGGTEAHEFMLLTPVGEDTLVLCDQCGYAANQQIATVRRPEPVAGEQRPTEEVATPGTATIADLAAFLGIPASETAKAIFFVADDGRLVTAIVRGDDEVNETKLANAVKGGGLRPAREDEIRAAGMEPGYASPVGVAAGKTFVVVDDLAAASTNLVAGANRPGYHLRNVNAGRDYQPDLVTDIANARAGDPCPNCGSPVRLENGIEVGNIFKLGTKYTEALGSTYLGEDGVEHPIVMGSYGIGVGRNLACIVEAHHDDKGIVWPASVAPVRGAPDRDRRQPRPAGRRDRGGAPRPLDRGRQRGPLRRPRGVAGRQAHRRRAAGHAPDPHRQPAEPGGRRARGDRSGDGRATHRPGRRGARLAGLSLSRGLPASERPQPRGPPLPMRLRAALIVCQRGVEAWPARSAKDAAMAAPRADRGASGVREHFLGSELGLGLGEVVGGDGRAVERDHDVVVQPFVRGDLRRAELAPGQLLLDLADTADREADLRRDRRRDHDLADRDRASPSTAMRRSPSPGGRSP